MGLEVHVPITSLESKLFCSCRNTSRYRPDKPNQYVCPTCLGLPGALPVPNRRAIIIAIRVASALEAKISRVLQFYRKHYFYPDLPKGYQITQYMAGGYYPIGINGRLELDGRSIGIRRIHLEEDPARLVHPSGMGESRRVLIDYNRSGNPLLEIVTEPELSSPSEARRFLERLIEILRDAGAIDEDIDVQLRVDVNISVAGTGRVEIKNIGSLGDVEKAIRFELMRLQRYASDGVEAGGETRHWDDKRRVTVSIREKEVEEEYRYFPDPNIPAINLDELIGEALKDMPIKIGEVLGELTSKYMVPESIAGVLVRDRRLLKIFRDIMDRHPESGSTYAPLVAKILVNEGLYLLNRGLISEGRLIELLSSISRLVAEGLLSEAEARRRLQSLSHRVRYREADEETIMDRIKSILNNVKKVDERDALRNYIVGQVLRSLEEDGYRVDMDRVVDIVERILDKYVSTPRRVRAEPGERLFKPAPYRESIVNRKISVRDALSMDGGRALLAGWLESRMNLGGKIFIILRDWTGRIQCVFNKDTESYSLASRIPRESFIIVDGEIVRDERAPGGVEVRARRLIHVGGFKSPPLTLLDISRSSIDVRLKYRYLDFRRMRSRYVFSIRSKLIKGIRSFLYDRGFTEINTPKIITTATEGGAELFPLLFYGREAFLAQSPQLYKQMALNLFERVFEIDSYYRAQKYDTPSHLAEFWSIDVEASLYTLDDLLSLIEDMVIYVIDYLWDEAEEEMLGLGLEPIKLSRPFRRINYIDIIGKLRDMGIDISFGDDLGVDELRMISNEYPSPYFIVYWPREVRAFYYKPNDDDPRLTNSFDFIWPMGNGYPLELASGGERINDPDTLIRSLREKGLFPEGYEWYIDMFKYGMPPHAGFGLGLDRLLMAILNLESIVEAVFSPRSPKRFKP